jgi:hypothetical protein
MAMLLEAQITTVKVRSKLKHTFTIITFFKIQATRATDVQTNILVKK